MDTENPEWSAGGAGLRLVGDTSGLLYLLTL